MQYLIHTYMYIHMYVYIHMHVLQQTLHDSSVSRMAAVQSAIDLLGKISPSAAQLHLFMYGATVQEGLLRHLCIYNTACSLYIHIIIIIHVYTMSGTCIYRIAS